jgi:hypothetical protein
VWHDVLEPDDENRDVVGGVMRQSVFEKLLAGGLRIVDFAYEVDGSLVADHIPKLFHQSRKTQRKVCKKW